MARNTPAPDTTKETAAPENKTGLAAPEVVTENGSGLVPITEAETAEAAKAAQILLTSGTDVDLTSIEAVTKHLEKLKAAANVPTILGAGPTLEGGDVVFIANHHTAPILLPRHGAVGMNVMPIVLQPGVSTPVNATEWAQRLKDNKTLQYYLDHNIISEVPREGQVAVSEVTLSKVLPPPNLRTEEEKKQVETGSGAAQIAATVKRSEAKVAEIKEGQQ